MARSRVVGSFGLGLRKSFDLAKADQAIFTKALIFRAFGELIVTSPVGDPDKWEVNGVASRYNSDVSAYNSELRADPANLDSRGRLRRGLKLNDGMKIRKPDGYVGGAFRGGWGIGINKRPNDFDASRPDASGNASTSRGDAALSMFSIGDKAHAGNTAPYGLRLEFEGHSKQAPLGIVRPTANKINEFAREIAAGMSQRAR